MKLQYAKFPKLSWKHSFIAKSSKPWEQLYFEPKHTQAESSIQRSARIYGAAIDNNSWGCARGGVCFWPLTHQIIFTAVNKGGYGELPSSQRIPVSVPAHIWRWFEIAWVTEIMFVFFTLYLMLRKARDANYDLIRVSTGPLHLILVASNHHA